MNAFEKLIYEWGRLATTFYPAGRWRWEKEWERRSHDSEYSHPTEEDRERWERDFGRKR